MKKFLLGLLRVVFELLQMILRPIGQIGTGISILFFILYGFICLVGDLESSSKIKGFLYIFIAFMFFSILWRIGTITLPVKVKEEIIVKVVHEKPSEETPETPEILEIPGEIIQEDKGGEPYEKT